MTYETLNRRIAKVQREIQRHSFHRGDCTVYVNRWTMEELEEWHASTTLDTGAVAELFGQESLNSRIGAKVVMDPNMKMNQKMELVWTYEV